MSCAALPRRLGNIRIGDRPAPRRWLQSWCNLHPVRACALHDTVCLAGRRRRNLRLIAHCVAMRHFEGVAGLMRFDAAPGTHALTLSSPYLSHPNPEEA